jgi:hypothetical protein
VVKAKKTVNTLMDLTVAACRRAPLGVARRRRPKGSVFDVMPVVVVVTVMRLVVWRLGKGRVREQKHQRQSESGIDFSH